jgi:hypothetical protein
MAPVHATKMAPIQWMMVFTMATVCSTVNYVNRWIQQLDGLYPL